MTDAVNVDVVDVVDVLVVGAGPAGLTAAAELRRLGVERVLLTDREAEPGGVPRHSQHTGYGLRDRHRVMTGPAYARALTDAAVRAGVDVRPGSTVTSLRADVAKPLPASAGEPSPGALAAVVTSARGVQTVRPSAVLLATGCRERPRAARLVPGDRPAGIMTTGELQQRVYLGGERLSGRALVVGAEHVAFSAAVTLAHAGADVIALVTDLERHQSYAAFRAGAALRWRTPVWTSVVVTRIDGPGGRLAGVEIADTAGGNPRYVPCELIVFTGDWTPITPWRARPGSRSTPEPGDRPSTRPSRRRPTACSRRATSCTRPKRPTSRRCPAACRPPDRGLSERPRGTARVPVEVAAPLRWISPNAVRPGFPAPLGRFTLRTAQFNRPAALEVRQDGRLLARSRLRRLIPGRPIHLAADWLAAVDPAAGPVRVAVSS